MCGFLGEFLFEKLILSDPKEFDELLALSKHRGPDSTKTWKNDHFQLGFNRLAILDLTESGNQPMQSPSKRYTIVFNGEIYNFRLLAEKFKLQNLKSTSDSEVIVHLLDLIGVSETIKSLNGMFAIAIADTVDNKLFLTRDFAGIKPMFFGNSDRGVVFASQFDQIFKHPWFKKSLVLNLEIVKEYFAFGYMQAPNTIYKNVFQLNPGEILSVDLKGKISKNFNTPFSKEAVEYKDMNSEDYQYDLKEKLEAAVERQLVSDVPIASFLSGGIDSPLISAYAYKAKKDIMAITLKVDSKTMNESEIAEQYAKAIKIEQIITEIRPSELLDQIDEHFLAFSEPFGDYSSIPTYAITKEARKKHTVMLSGDGGDELFFGYPRMLDVLKKQHWFKLPYIIRTNLVRITNKLGLTNTWSPFYSDLDEFVMHKHIHIPKTVLDKTFIGTAFSDVIKQLYKPKNPSKNLLNQLRVNEFYAHLQRVLIKVDRASMKNSLEVRVPFLDKDCLEHAFIGKMELNVNSDLKKPLKLLLSREVPKEIINKKKMGFTVPLSDWFHTTLKEDLNLYVFQKPFYGSESFNADELKQYVQAFLDKKHNNAWGVWHIYSWQKWAYLHLLNQ